MSALSSGFFSDQARADAGSAFENALNDLKVKYERKAAEEEAKKAAEEADAAEDDSDAELDALMADPELERIRAARIKEMKAAQERRRKQLALGHGRYKYARGSGAIACQYTNRTTLGGEQGNH